MKVAFAKVTKLTDFWGRVISLITGGPYKHTEIIFSQKASSRYIQKLMHDRPDYFDVWIRNSHYQIRSASERARVIATIDLVTELPTLRLCFSSSAMDRGVRFKLIDLEPKKWDFISCDGDQEMEKDLIEWCEIQVGRGYDFLGLAGFILCHLKLVKPDHLKVWCSEIIEDALYRTHHLYGPKLFNINCPKAKWYRPPSPVSLWKHLSKLPQPLRSAIWTK